MDDVPSSGTAKDHDVCTPMKVFPLGGERVEDLVYPSVTYHYSVGTNARHVYVIGALTEFNHSQLYVWDLHRGSARNYAVLDLDPGNAQIKHLYEIKDARGMIICKTAASFFIYSARICHKDATVKVEQLLLSYPAEPDQFWSSARAGSGIIFIAEGTNNQSLYLAHVNFDKPTHPLIVTSDTAILRFTGQPWVYGNHIYLFESERREDRGSKCLTGRLVRTDLKYGRLELVNTISDKSAQFPEDCYGRMPHRMKHVERDGFLWVISETTRPAVLSVQNNFNTDCCVGVLNMQTLRWNKLNWTLDAQFDQLTLDVTPHGTVVLLKKIFSQRFTKARVDSFYFVKTRKPDSLQMQSFLALIKYFPKLREIRECEIRTFGIPRYLLS